MNDLKTALSAQTAPLERARIWIIEDSPAQAQLAAQCLVEHEVEIFPEATAALERLAIGPSPALIVLDWELPGTSGLEVLRTIRTSQDATRLPVLVLTVHAEREDLIAGLDAGANDYVAKPFDPALLRARVSAQLRLRELAARAVEAERALRTERDHLIDASWASETLYRVTALLTRDLDLDVIVQRLTDEATALCRASFGSFFYNVENEQGESYMLYTLSGVPREAFARFPMPRNTAVFAPTFAGKGIVRSDDITKDPRYGHSPPHYGMPPGHLPVRSYLAVPVVSRSGEVLGGLFFGHAETGRFSELHEQLLVAIAGSAAVAIDNARLYRVARRAEESRAELLAHAQTARAAAEASEAHFRAVADSMPQLVWSTRADGYHDYYNRRWYEFVGLPPEKTSGHQWAEQLHPDDRERARTRWEESLRSGEPYEIQYRFRRHDGVYRWFLARALPLRDADGAITRWFGTCTDIEDHKRAEAQAALLGEVGHALVATLDVTELLAAFAARVVPALADWCAVCVRRADGSTEISASAHADPAGAALLRGPLASTALLAPSAPYLVDEVLATGRTRFVPVTTLATDAAAALREIAPASLVTAPLAVPGRTLGAVVFARLPGGLSYDRNDVAVAEELARRVAAALDNARLFEMTQRERRRAEEANRAKDEFMSIASHELRTPLNAILGWARMLRAGSLPESKRERALETIERNARIQAQLVDDILDVSRIVTGKLRLDVSPVDAGHVVEAALDVVRPAAEAKGVRLQALLDPDAGLIHGDAGRLQQVVWNLLSNAVKFTPKGGRVYVRVQRESSSVAIVVADTGQGIASAFLPHVFEPFRQADASITRVHGGLGLGLAIVKHLIELHGGTIEAQSDGPGQGTTFTVRIPVAPLRSTSLTSVPSPAVHDSRETGTIECPPELDGLRVLVVDDEPDARELVQSVLEQCRARVSVAGSAAEALAALRAAPPDVLVSDIGMPDESGYELIRKVRALPPEQGGRTPAVALTAFASMHDRTRALMEGFTAHAAKPTEPQELVAVIAALVGRHSRP